MKIIDFLKIKNENWEKYEIYKKTAFKCTNENASFAAFSFIEKSGKLHTIAEDLILLTVKDIVSAMIGKEAANSLNKISLSNDTIKKIDSLSGNNEKQLLRRVNKKYYFRSQLDESTDITNKLILLCYVRYEY